MNCLDNQLDVSSSGEEDDTNDDQQQIVRAIIRFENICLFSYS